MIEWDVAPAGSGMDSDGEADVMLRRVGSEAIFRLRDVFVGFVGDAVVSTLASRGFVELSTLRDRFGDKGLILLESGTKNTPRLLEILELVSKVVVVIRPKRLVNGDISGLWHANDRTLPGGLGGMNDVGKASRGRQDAGGGG